MLFDIRVILTFIRSNIFINMRTDILERKDEILEWINEGQSKTFICKQLNCRPLTLGNWLDKMGIEYKGNQGGKNIRKDPKRKTAEEYIKSTYINTGRLKKKLIEDGIKEHRCENCTLSKWLDNPIPLELHHVDGNRDNNEFNNLELLCPNCHSLTDNYRGKNIRGCGEIGKHASLKH